MLPGLSGFSGCDGLAKTYVVRKLDLNRNHDLNPVEALHAKPEHGGPAYGGVGDACSTEVIKPQSGDPAYDPE